MKLALGHLNCFHNQWRKPVTKFGSGVVFAPIFCLYTQFTQYFTLGGHSFNILYRPTCNLKLLVTIKRAEGEWGKGSPLQVPLGARENFYDLYLYFWQCIHVFKTKSIGYNGKKEVWLVPCHLTFAKRFDTTLTRVYQQFFYMTLSRSHRWRKAKDGYGIDIDTFLRESCYWSEIRGLFGCGCEILGSSV